jgi:hypothetical protein
MLFQIIIGHLNYECFKFTIESRGTIVNEFQSAEVQTVNQDLVIREASEGINWLQTGQMVSSGAAGGPGSGSFHAFGTALFDALMAKPRDGFRTNRWTVLWITTAGHSFQDHQCLRPLGG